jgi:hypothetical protein
MFAKNAAKKKPNATAAMKNGTAQKTSSPFPFLKSSSILLKEQALLLFIQCG